MTELIYDSDVFAKTTAEHIFSGIDFDRTLRGILIVDEVLHMRLLEKVVGSAQ